MCDYSNMILKKENINSGSILSSFQVSVPGIITVCRLPVVRWWGGPCRWRYYRHWESVRVSILTVLSPIGQEAGRQGRAASTHRFAWECVIVMLVIFRSEASYPDVLDSSVELQGWKLNGKTPSSDPGDPTQTFILNQNLQGLDLAWVVFQGSAGDLFHI